MNPQEAALDYPFADTLPEPGRKLAIAPGVWWIRQPLPFALDHINLWLLRDRFDGRDGWTVVDCGVATDAARGMWRQVIDHELEGLPIVRILCTHMHPDHLGNAAWLQASGVRPGAAGRPPPPLWMTLGEYAMGRILQAALAGTDGPGIVAHYRAHGLVDPTMIEALGHRIGYYPRLVPEIPLAFRRIVDGESIAIDGDDWTVITGFGHSPEHASLHSASRDILISGDMLLPKISTNVSVHGIEPESNPVQQFVDSIERYRDLPEPTLVLPSHGRPFRRMHRRIDQLVAHHAERLADVLAHCATPRTAADIVPVMFRRPLDAHQLFFAFGEALAHLHALWYRGQLRRTLGADGTYRFVQA